jgi:hypothetical protein
MRPYVLTFEITMLSISVSNNLKFNQLIDFHETWFGHYALECHPIIVLYFLTIGYNNMVDARICEVGPRLAPLNIFLKLCRPIDVHRICDF